MKTYFRSYHNLQATGLLALCLAVSCKKFVQIPPPSTEITGATVYTNNASAAAVMTGIYSNLVASTNFAAGGVSIGYLMGLSADELTNYVPSNAYYEQFYENALVSYENGASNYYFWGTIYNNIYACNAVSEGLQNSTGVTASAKRQITGEAEFMRGFLHFYATNLYGDVPLVITTNYQFNNTRPRSPQAMVYQQIIADLKDAESKLPTGFVDANGNATSERTRPNKGTAQALLARVYLYYGNLTGDQSNYTKAVTLADSVISHSQYSLVSDLNSVFLANSNEAIWQLAPNSPGLNTWDAYAYVLHGAPSVTLSPFLINAFEPGDQRFVDWVGVFNSGGTNYFYPYKYKVWQRNLPVTEYTMVLRLGEQYLIRAEAEANSGDSTAAVADLNTIRSRAGLPAYSATTNGSLLTAIQHERQVELFTEWGHRWFDLKRTSTIGSVMGAPGNVCTAKGGTWNANKELLPIPLQELRINSNLQQNPGY